MNSSKYTKGVKKKSLHLNNISVSEDKENFPVQIENTFSFPTEGTVQKLKRSGSKKGEREFGRDITNINNFLTHMDYSKGRVNTETNEKKVGSTTLKTFFKREGQSKSRLSLNTATLNPRSSHNTSKNKDEKKEEKNEKINHFCRQRKNNSSFNLDYPLTTKNAKVGLLSTQNATSKQTPVNPKPNEPLTRKNSDMKKIQTKIGVFKFEKKVEKKEKVEFSTYQAYKKRQSSAKPKSTTNVYSVSINKENIPSNINPGENLVNPFSTNNQNLNINVNVNGSENGNGNNIPSYQTDNFESTTLVNSNNFLGGSTDSVTLPMANIHLADSREDLTDKHTEMLVETDDNFCTYSTGIDTNGKNSKQSKNSLIEQENIMNRNKENIPPVINSQMTSTLNSHLNSQMGINPSNLPQNGNSLINALMTQTINSTIDHYTKTESVPDHLKEYIQDIYFSLLQEEQAMTLTFGYMQSQNDINEQMRAILLDWLVEVHLKFNLREETLFLSASIIDRYLAIQHVNRSQLQLLGVAALMIACKEEEIFTPHIRDFVYITDKAYSSQEVLGMEREILKKMEFNILSPSSFRFFEIISHFLNFRKKDFMLGRYFLEVCLIDYRMNKYSPSLLACTCAYITMKYFNLPNYHLIYSSFLIANSNTGALKDCAKEICILIDNLTRTNLTALKRKFSKDEFCNVSNLTFS